MMKKAAKRAFSPPPQGPAPEPVVIQCTTSDGTLTFSGGHNGPTDEPSGPDPEDGLFFKEIPHYSKKELHWLERLATLVVESKAAHLKSNGARCVLSSLPANYRLFEQIRVTPNKTGTKTTRNDTYLYGHPKGPKKRYRSPQEFYPHFFWLVTDETRNPKNCECDKCRGSASDPVPVTVTEKPVQAPVQQERRETRSSASAAPRPQPQPVPESKPVTRRNPARTAVMPTPPISQPRPQQGPTPTLVPENILLSAATHRERDNDLSPIGVNIYRRGEQVWFQSGPHWALGVVLDVPNMSTSTPGYAIHPLHSPLLCDTSATHSNIPAQQLRPWVAWSTPPISNPALDLPDVPYASLPWTAHASSPSIEVDASILMARSVDASYTLIEKLTTQRHYSGLYYGAEKFWVGDTIRLKSSAHETSRSAMEIMVVSGIQDFMTSPEPDTIRSLDTEVLITGDIYRLTSHPHQVPAPHALPPAVVQDLEIRRKFTVPNNPSQPHWTYSNVAHGQTVKLQTVKGRWYPSAALYQIFNGDDKLRSGVGIPVGEWDATGSGMNEMGSGGNAGTLGWCRHREREGAFWRGIPRGVSFKVTQPPQQQQQQQPTETRRIEQDMRAMELQQQQQQAQQQQQHQQQHEVVDLTEDGDSELIEDDLMRKMREDAATFFVAEEDVDDFYGGL